MTVTCKYQENCSGCQLLGTSLKEQQHQKTNHLSRLLAEAEISPEEPVVLVSPGGAGLRDRVDLVFDRSREKPSLGLYKKNTRQILDIEECAQLSPALQAWLEKFRTYDWPIQKGSLRLRVGPGGQKGVWLDFANVDIKKLLDEKTLLQALQTEAFVEIGQRRKVPVFVEGRYKLQDPEPRIWFQSWIEGQAVDLYCSVASFTQPGILANRELIRIFETWFQKLNIKNILEFGSGIGNLSFPALGISRTLTACEIDEGALAGFRKSLEKLSERPGFEDCQSRVRILRGDFQNRNPQDFEKYEAVLANPPRSGLKSFLQPLIGANNKPPYFMYMSCFPESFIVDGKQLQLAGYKLKEIKIVDQFPQTTHYEILSLWSL